MKHRREEDKWLLNRLWSRYSVLIGLGAFVISMASVGHLIAKAEAFDGRLNAIEERQVQYAEDQSYIKGQLRTILAVLRQK